MATAKVLHESSVRRQRMGDERQDGRTDRDSVLVMTRSLDQSQVWDRASERGDIAIQFEYEAVQQTRRQSCADDDRGWVEEGVHGHNRERQSLCRL